MELESKMCCYRVTKLDYFIKRKSFQRLKTFVIRIMVVVSAHTFAFDTIYQLKYVLWQNFLLQMRIQLNNILVSIPQRSNGSSKQNHAHFNTSRQWMILVISCKKLVSTHTQLLLRYAQLMIHTFCSDRWQREGLFLIIVPADRLLQAAYLYFLQFSCC